MKKFKISESEDKNGICIEYKSGKTKEGLMVKLDFEKEIAKPNGRPRYTYESGKVKFADFETDAHFLQFTESEGRLAYSGVTFMKFIYKGQTIHEATPTSHTLQPDGSDTKWAPTKWRTLEDEVKLK